MANEKCKDCKFLFCTICNKNKFEFPDTEEGWEQAENHEICENFKHKYIQYPIEVSKINLPEDAGICDHFSKSRKTGSLVKIRPCAKEYEGKTYLGFLIGEADTQLTVKYNEETKELSIGRFHNPAILVPELNKVFYGYESWWGIVQSEEELTDISDDVINNTWYVKLLKAMNN